MFSALLFMRQMWFFLNFRFLIKIIVLNKQWITICFDLTIDIKGDIKKLKKLIMNVENLEDIF